MKEGHCEKKINAASVLGAAGKGKPKDFSKAERKRRSERMKALNVARRAESRTPCSALRSHPEQRHEELYLGNTRPEDVWRSSWRTSRLGENPLKADGTPYNYGDLKPWFIQRAEVQAEIEKEKRNAQPWRPERIRVFEEMLAAGITQNADFRQPETKD